MSGGEIVPAGLPVAQASRIDNLRGIAFIENAEAEATVVDGLAFIQTVSRNLERARKELVDPLNGRVKEINAAFKRLAEPVDAAESHTKRLLLDWRDRERKRIAAEQEKIRLENERREKEEAERVAKEKADVAAITEEKAIDAGFSSVEAKELGELEASDVAPAAPVVVAAPAPLAPTSKSTLGTATERMVWKYEVQNPELVPRAYLAVDVAKIRTAVAAGVRDIPGVRIFQEPIIAGGRSR